MIALRDLVGLSGGAHFLLVEDNPGDATFIGELLDMEAPDLETVGTLSEAKVKLAQDALDAVLLDLRLPDGTGVDCVTTIRTVAAEIPIVVLTGLEDDVLALECLAAGAQDYIAKNELRASSLARAIRYAIARTREARERSRADELQDLLAGIVNASDDAIFSGAPDGRITSWNAAAERMFGFTPEEALGKPAAEVIRATDIQGAVEQRGIVELALEGNSIKRAAVRRQDKGGHKLTLSVNTFGIRDLDGEVRHFGAICRDVTEQMARDEQLQQQYGALLERDRQMRALTARLNSVREDEQQRISREVHDGLGQLVTGLKMDISWMRRRVSDDGVLNGKILLARLGETEQLLDEMVEAVQRIAAQLRPSALDVLGLAAAIRDEARRFEQRIGVRVFCNVVDTPSAPPEVATAFFRIFQELMTNVARHAEASRVHVDFACLGSDWVLTVSDNGHGFPAKPNGKSSLGLLGMRERAEQLGGDVKFARGELSGASVTVRIPA